jgi:hypothetical protein
MGTHSLLPPTDVPVRVKRAHTYTLTLKLWSQLFGTPEKLQAKKKSPRASVVIKSSS